MQILTAHKVYPIPAIMRCGREMTQRGNANAERRFLGSEVVPPDVPSRFMRHMGRACKDHHALVAEFNTSSGADTPTLRQLDGLAAMTGFKMGSSDNPIMPGAPMPGEPSASSPRR